MSLFGIPLFSAVVSVNRIGAFPLIRWMGSTARNDLKRIREVFSQYPGGSVNLQLKDETGIAEIIFSNPEKRNAFSGTMMVQLADAVDQLEKWTDGKAVILRSPGDVFCSGGDLEMVKQICTPEEGLEFATLMQDTLYRFLRLPLISVTLVQGNALGGGAELAILSDFRVGTTTCNFQFVQKQMGISTGFGGGTRLVQLLGPTKALELLLSCRRVFAEEALHLGLLSCVLKPEVDLLSQVHDWLSPMTRGPAQAIRTMKKVVHTALTSDTLENSLFEERKLFAKVWGLKLHKETVDKVYKKR